MKTILSAALVLVICGLVAAPAFAQDQKADPVGTWKCEYKIGDQQRTATLTITKDGDNLAGTMSWPDQKDEKLKDVKLTDDQLTFAAERRLGENKFNLEYKLTVAADTLKGQGAIVMPGGEKRPFDFEGKREKKDT